MWTIVIATGSVTAIGLLCSILLVVVSKFMAVTTDERVAFIREALPGVNCGACGFSGCDGYSAALVAGGTAVNLCIPGGDLVSRQIGVILDMAPGDDVPMRVAVVHCIGDTGARREKMEYRGLHSCSAARRLYGGEGACAFGCIGYGECADVCPNGAICVERGLARVDPRKCTGCGLCVKVCPNKVISIEDVGIAVAVRCMSTESAASVSTKCTVGCIACMRCVKACEAGAITVNGFLAQIDYTKCTGCGKCADSCNRGCIKRAGQ